MAYRRSTSRRAPARRSTGYRRSTTTRARRVSAGRASRRTSARSGGRGFARGGELRIVIEQAGSSSASRYPGVAAKLNPAPTKAKF